MQLDPRNISFNADQMADMDAIELHGKIVSQKNLQGTDHWPIFHRPGRPS
jgi:hypothetical protein